MLTLAVMMTTTTTTVLILIFCLIGHCPLLTKLPKTILLTKASSTRFDFFLSFYSGLHCLIFLQCPKQRIIFAPIVAANCSFNFFVVCTSSGSALQLLFREEAAFSSELHDLVLALLQNCILYNSFIYVFVFQDGESNVEIHEKEAEGDADKDDEADKSKEMEGDASLVSIENLHFVFYFYFSCELHGPFSQ